MKHIIPFLAFVFVLGACSSTPDKKADDPEANFKIAQDYDKDERYEEAIRHYQEVKNKFPYSKYAALSELAIADAYYKQESYPEAQVAYQNFKDLHPKHAQIDYVVFRLGMSYYEQLPPTSDRDLSLAAKVLENFDELLRTYPNSQYAKEAQENKMATMKLLAEKELYIADFYWKKEQYSAAMKRYESGLHKYPGQGFDAKELAQAARCAEHLADLDHARTLLKELRERFPDSSELKSAEQEIH